MIKGYETVTQAEPAAVGTLCTWWRRPPHEVRNATLRVGRRRQSGGQVIVPLGQRSELFDPFKEPGLVNALLAVAQGRCRPVEFANKFGLLGYHHIHGTPAVEPAGDPVPWFMAHARTVWAISELTARLKELAADPGLRDSLTDFLKDEIPGFYAAGGAVVQLPYRPRPSPSPVQKANAIIRDLLNANLGNAGARRLQSTARGGLRTIFTFRTLVEVVYWRLADELVRGAIRRCEEPACRRVFAHPNPNRKYCSTRCKNLCNIHKFREKPGGKNVRRKERKRRRPRRRPPR